MLLAAGGNGRDGGETMASAFGDEHVKLAGGDMEGERVGDGDGHGAGILVLGGC